MKNLELELKKLNLEELTITKLKKTDGGSFGPMNIGVGLSMRFMFFNSLKYRLA